MAESLASMLWVTLLVFAMGCISAKRFSIMAPNVFHIGVAEQVSVSVFDAGIPVTVKLYLQDYPHRKKTFSQVQGRVAQGSNLFLPVKVEAANLPDTASVDKQFVYLVAKSDDAHFSFHKEAKILLSYKDGMVFIQTDKPIYTPRQSVKIRVIPLEFDMKPSKREITLVVLNPQGIRVQQWKNLDTSTGIISKRLDLDDFTLSGNWTIAAFYGHKDFHNTSVQFEVKEYVLPKFSVRLSVPPYILNSDNVITINMTTRYTYGKPVVGTAVVSLSLAGRNGSIVPFARHNIMLDKSGVTSLSQRIQIIQELPGDYWFPEKGRLLVEADVIEQATGNKESAMDKSCQFTSSPYLIEFKNTPKYFKPGLRYVVKVVVTYPNKQPAGDVPMLISAKGKEGDQETELKKFDRDPNVRSVTDELGKAEFVIDACSKCQAITIQVETDNNRLEESQNAVANYLVKPFNAENGPLILVRQLTPGKVGRKIQCESYRDSNAGDAVRLSFAVVSRGRILSHNTTDPFDGKFKSWSVFVTSQMSPSARLIVYYIDNNERVVADSILLNVEDSLPTKVDFPDAYVEVDGSRVQLNKVEKSPGQQYTLKIKASPGTRLGLMSVDQSVYLLRDDNRLTKERIFKAAEELDLGCGVGGGKDNKDVFKVGIQLNHEGHFVRSSRSAGVVVMTNNFVSNDNGREDYGCGEENSRKKRSVQNDIEDKICCDMGKDSGNVTCGKLSIDSNRQLSRRCRLKFWQCCKALHGTKDTALLGRSGLDDGDFGFSDEQILDQSQVRSFFPETWIYDEKVVGPGGLVRMDVTIPDTITTWVMQAVAINNQTGLGLATPLRIVGFKDLFISLKLPYSVKKGEQVSLLATVFNYDPEEMRVKLYLKGDKDFCSTAADGKYAVIGIVRVPPNDARSVAVPIVPKRIGEIFLEVSSIFQVKDHGSYVNSAGDTVIRKLLVVPEGKEHRRSQSFTLDPNGFLNDGPVDGENTTDKQTQTRLTSIRNLRPNEQLQFDVIDLNFTDRVKAIPGSIRAVVYLTGNLLGPVVNTTIQGGLEKKFQLPTGCGEQMMIQMAPNVYILEYLMKTNQLTGADEEKAYRFIQHGYNRVFMFRLNDMSFSGWGNSRPGSGNTWLTAFVMRILCHARQFSGVNIDETVVCASVDFLIKNQRLDDGALPEVKKVKKGRSMVGGAYDEGEVTMTAFVLSTLSECSCNEAKSKETIRRATDYLEKQYNTLSRPYSMALTAYALALVNSKEKLKANERLVQNAVYDNVRKTRHWNAGGNALDVETAGYALLTQVILGRITYASPIVTYLTNQRRGGEGFISTQDTVVALQALSLYSEKTAGNALDLRVRLTSEVAAEWKPPEIHISPENALLRREIDVKNFLGGKLFVETRGTGVGLLEVEVRYNLPTSRDEICKFDLKTTVKELKDKPGNLFGPVQSDAEGEGENKRPVERKKASNKKRQGKGRRRCKGKNKNKRRCRDKGKKPRPPPKHQPVSSIQLKVCTRYRETENTSMGIMDIGILTGFKPDQKSLKKLQESLPDYLDNVEVSDRSLILYFSEIPNHRELCVDVQFDRVFYVGVVQAVPVKVYDYYEPDESCSVFYGPDKHSPLNLGVCEVGSSSCKCTQDECTQRDPPMGNINKLIKKACNEYHYVIKGKVLLIDEQNTMLAYLVEVVQIIQQGNKDLNVGQRIELWKRGVCQSPELKENKEYLFMGLDKGDRYELDKTSFVKLWPRSPDNNKDKLLLEDFAAQYTC